MNTKTLDPELDVDILDKVEESAKIILVNDDHNSFQHVVDCLMKYCKHSETQAHQCTMIIHNNGSYAVKEGDYDKLVPIHRALCDAGLLAEID